MTQGGDTNAQTLPFDRKKIDNGNQVGMDETTAEKRGGDHDSSYDHLSTSTLPDLIVECCTKLTLSLQGDAPADFEKDQHDQPDASGEDCDVAWIGSQFGK